MDVYRGIVLAAALAKIDWPDTSGDETSEDVGDDEGQGEESADLPGAGDGKAARRRAAVPKSVTPATAARRRFG
jgi:hypothetical protein